MSGAYLQEVIEYDILFEPKDNGIIEIVITKNSKDLGTVDLEFLIASWIKAEKLLIEQDNDGESKKLLFEGSIKETISCIKTLKELVALVEEHKQWLESKGKEKAK